MQQQCRFIQMVCVVGLVLLVGCTTPRAWASETKRFVAYSMRVAQTRVEEALRTREDFRTKQPDLFYLGGITKPWAVVLDPQTGDWILVGERDSKTPVLMLDDWVAALRARFIHGEEDPGVTIDPRPSEAHPKAGQKKGVHDSTRQDVRFFGGITDTHFGQVCYEADWLMKKIGLGLEKLPVKQLKTYYDLAVEQVQKAGLVRTSVASRFWFYPTMNRVNVWGDVVLLEAFQMGVFTEVLSAQVSGKPVVDVAKFEDYPSEGFSRSFSESYDAAAEVREVLGTLRGLTRLAALAKGLRQVDEKPKVDFFLMQYPLAKMKTPKEVEVLRVEHRKAGFEISGGVSLMALAIRLRGGDVRALKEVVVGTRPVAEALSWGFEIEMEDGQLKGVVLPPELADHSQLAPLFQQAMFLQKQKRYDAAIESYGKLLQLDPNNAVAYNNRGVAYAEGKQDYDQAITDYNKALTLDPNYVGAYVSRGAAYLNGKQDYDRAIADFTQALALDPNAAVAYSNRGAAYAKGKQDYNQALADLAQALILDPNSATAYSNRGVVYSEYMQDYDRALADLTQALLLDPNSAEAYYNRGLVYLKGKQDYDRAITDYNKALALDPSFARAYYNRGNAYLNGKRDYDRAIADFTKLIALTPNDVIAYSRRGFAYGKKRLYERAFADFDKALALNPNAAEVYNDRGDIYRGKGNFDQALADFDKALALAPNAVEVHFNKALVFDVAKRRTEAVATYRKFIELAPAQHASSIQWARERIKSLKLTEFFSQK